MLVTPLSAEAERQHCSISPGRRAGVHPRRSSPFAPRRPQSRVSPPTLASARRQPRPRTSLTAVRRLRETGRGESARPPAAPSPFPNSGSGSATAPQRPLPPAFGGKGEDSPHTRTHAPRERYLSGPAPLCFSPSLLAGGGSPSTTAASGRAGGEGAAHYVAGRDTWAPPPAPARPLRLTIWQRAGSRLPPFPRRPSAKLEAGGG
ncbi:COPII coat assembly protein SEC16-like [Aquila chrysaetos chrysaetos]|uniref:COPII coat assembly protein SEC16-like n=1 Tax=Aquila chrysaetos chrysaetos TaxID=223781 RepID=UPI001176D974|nr:COPII coat assembly protein SEC16-like [Aquila chrysaetos chrysaetos]